MADRHPFRRGGSGRSRKRGWRGASGSDGVDFLVVRRANPSRTQPIRLCVGCRTRAPASELLRVVVVGCAVTPDPRRRLPGRGASLHPVPACLTLAERRRAFGRALRATGVLDIGALSEFLGVADGGVTPTPHGSRNKAGRPA
ncbi:YlxR family protein [Longispora sp. K20-0274]|uniref:YlxR family protein n=1 Tax=Longispora sp. K20-0274 TaxID=3088255 RepID=UPI003999AC7C